jgi:hypothetical protein
MADLITMEVTVEDEEDVIFLDTLSINRYEKTWRVTDPTEFTYIEFPAKDEDKWMDVAYRVLENLKQRERG